MGGTLHSTMGASMAQYSQLTGAGASAFPGLDESMSVGLESIESEFDRANRMAEAEHAAKRARMKAARRAERRPKPVTIPWRLLDELEGEKRKFQRCSHTLRTHNAHTRILHSTCQTRHPLYLLLPPHSS